MIRSVLAGALTCDELFVHFLGDLPVHGILGVLADGDVLEQYGVAILQLGEVGCCQVERDRLLLLDPAVLSIQDLHTAVFQTEIALVILRILHGNRETVRGQPDGVCTGTRS